jgi:hypothetical protein
MKDKNKNNPTRTRTSRTKTRFVRPTYKSVTERLVAAMRDVRGHRQMNAHESPESQAAWDRLTLAVLEAERVLQVKITRGHIR